MRVVFAGGGTGGHLQPGVHLASALRALDPDVHCTFLVTGRPTERVFLGDLPGDIVTFRAKPPGGRLEDTVRFGLRLLPALSKAAALYRELRPSAVVGLGGYGSLPACLAARLARVPLFLVEQNVLPGRANRLLARSARIVFCQWGETASRLSAGRSVLTGCPLGSDLGGRATVEDYQRLGLHPWRRTLLVMGGSQGARSINHLMQRSLGVLRRHRHWLQVIHLCGPESPGEVHWGYRRAGIGAHVEAFSHRMPFLYACSDLALCRAGGTTCAELVQAALPAVLVPYPWDRRRHQLENARVLAGAGAARILEEGELVPAALERSVIPLLGDGRALGCMSRAALGLARPEAAMVAARALLREIGPRDRSVGCWQVSTFVAGGRSPAGGSRELAEVGRGGEGT